MIEIHTLPIFHLGMSHDGKEYNGCGVNTEDNGYMASQLGRWSSCSKKSFMEHYSKLKSSDRWCLPPGKYLTKALSNMLFCFKNT